MLGHWSELVGFTASLLVFITFSMRTMIPLRIVAILSNVAFIAYGLGAHLMPILVLHSALLPMNVFRLRQHLDTFRQIRAAGTGMAQTEALLPFMRAMEAPEGTMLFRVRDPASELYFLSEGRILLPEIGKELGPGELFGEVGLFSRDGRRTASAICLERCKIFNIDKARIHELCLRDPAFVYFLIKLIASRLDDNMSRPSDNRDDIGAAMPPEEAHVRR